MASIIDKFKPRVSDLFQKHERIIPYDYRVTSPANINIGVDFRTGEKTKAELEEMSKDICNQCVRS